MNYLFVLTATVLLAFEFALSKKYQATEGTGMAAGLRFNLLSGIFTAGIFFALSGFQPGFSWFSVTTAFAMSLCAMTYSILGFKILKTGGMAVYSLFLMLGGMLLPYAYGVLFLEESLTPLRLMGVLLIAAAVICSGKVKYRFGSRVYVYCFLVFLLNGAVSILSKCHQISLDLAPVSSTAFVMYSGIGKALFSAIALPFCKGPEKKSVKIKKNALAAVAGAALIGGSSYVLQLIGAKELPATVLYPIVTGGSIVFSALSGKVFFREQLTVYQLVSIGLCFAGTLLFL